MEDRADLTLGILSGTAVVEVPAVDLVVAFVQEPSLVDHSEGMMA